MREDLNATSPSPEGGSREAAKLPWHTPTFEEIDYMATEASFQRFGGVDFGAYTGAAPAG